MPGVVGELVVSEPESLCGDRSQRGPGAKGDRNILQHLLSRGRGQFVLSEPSVSFCTVDIYPCQLLVKISDAPEISD